MERGEKNSVVNNICQQCGESIPFVIQMGTGCFLTSLFDFSLWLIRLLKWTLCRLSTRDHAHQATYPQCMWEKNLFLETSVYVSMGCIQCEKNYKLIRIVRFHQSSLAKCFFLWNGFRKQLYDVILLLICIYDFLFPKKEYIWIWWKSRRFIFSNAVSVYYLEWMHFKHQHGIIRLLSWCRCL